MFKTPDYKERNQPHESLIGDADSASLSDNAQKIPFRFKLSTKLLLLIALSVFITEVLVFVPSIANMRHRWVERHYRAAETISYVLDEAPDSEVDNGAVRKLLGASDAYVITRVENGSRRDIVAYHHPEQIDEVVDLGNFNETKAILDSFMTLISAKEHVIKIIGPANANATTIEYTLSTKGLRQEMLDFSGYFLLLSLTIAVVAATLIYLVVLELLARPLQNIYNNMLGFVMEPDNPSRIIVPESRRDEVGATQKRLATIERELQKSFSRQKHLANLGLAVSKINHDMRNILASAQLMSDHLSEVKDPLVQKLAPKLIRAIDRATSYSQSVVTYGRTQESRPERQKLFLRKLVDEVRDTLSVEGFEQVEFQNFVPEDFEIDADIDQLYRVLSNLCRNAVQAMVSDNDCAVKRITIRAGRMGTTAMIDVEDTGAGMPEKAKEHLFSPFQGSLSKDGSGLGLAICDELIRGHGGSITLLEDGKPGTHFEIRIPDLPTTLADYRKKRA